MAAEPESTVTLVAIDDDQESLDLVKDALAALDGLQVLTAPHPEEGLRLVQRHHPEIVLLDLVMPGLGGMELLDRILAFAPSTDVLLITGHYSTESAVEAIQKGASDYLNKPLSISVLRQRVGKLLEDAKRRQMSRRLGADLARASQFEGMLGTSPLMLEVFARIRRVAPHFRSALITGATGTGKDLVSRAFHQLSPASSGNFVVCNASAVVETLFESELFGHVRGAFTGATQDKMGLFEHAHGGTLFLDEIGDMPLSTQAKLLRAVQNQEVQRVGSLTVRKVDVRVVAATNRDLRAMIAERQFREDLFYRLSMVQVKLPRLAERREDILLLARQFVERRAADYNKPLRGLTSRAEIALSRYSWPGNVRELENVIANACMMAEGEFVDARDLPAELSSPTAAVSFDDDEMLPLSEVERRHALKVLNRLNGNKTQAAKILGINRATLHRLLEQAEASVEAAGK